jgi:glucan-binding YG repeat protein
MRKQTKLVAVASAAALLAIGASMTSFAAAGWVEEDGQWYYYDKDGNKVEDTWKKSGDNWYWLDSEEGGAMAVDKLIEDDDNTYYVDSNGVMVKNTWVKVVNEDQDDEDDPAEYNYYYMQSNGKAYKQGSSSSTLNKKTIDGKVYAFDEDGKMLYGWVDSNGEMQNGDTDWQTTEDLYYFGTWDDGAMKTGWQRISVYDDRGNKDDDYDYWFNFKSNGKRRSSTNKKKLNGKYYAFDDAGVMIYEWYQTGDSTTSSNTGATVSDSKKLAENWNYFSSPEDGARVVKGWFKVVPPEDDNTFLEITSLDDSFAKADSDDESERWYYADNDGLVAGEIKKIKGKYYGFYPSGDDHAGRMLTGLCALEMDGSKIVRVIKCNMDGDEFDDFMDSKLGVNVHENQEDTNVYLYYFGADSQKDTDGAMKTGATTITLDGDTYNFYFSKTGGAESKGRGVNGLDGTDYIYMYGQKVKADADDKYRVVYAKGDYNSADSVAYDMDLSDFRNALEVQELGINKDHETVKGILADQVSKNYYLVNTSGKIQKSGAAKKDGDDWYWYVDDYAIKMYTNNKTLSNSSTVGTLPTAVTKKNGGWADFANATTDFTEE